MASNRQFNCPSAGQKRELKDTKENLVICPKLVWHTLTNKHILVTTPIEMRLR
jgi:hypothetical protein